MLTHRRLSALLTQGLGKAGPWLSLTSEGRCTALMIR